MKASGAAEEAASLASFASNMISIPDSKLEEIKDIADKIYDDILHQFRFVPKNLPIYRYTKKIFWISQFPIATLKIKDLLGNEQNIYFKWGYSEELKGGGYSRIDKNNNDIYFIIRSDQPIKKYLDLGEDLFKNFIYQTLVHEVTHAIDPKLLLEDQRESSDNLSEYLNDPVEIKAFMRQIYEKNKNKFLEYFNKSKDFNLTFKNVIFNDSLFTSIIKNLDDKNKKHLISGLYTAFDKFINSKNIRKRAFLQKYAVKTKEDLIRVYQGLKAMVDPQSGATDNERKIALETMEKYRNKFPNINF